MSSNSRTTRSTTSRAPETPAGTGTTNPAGATDGTQAPGNGSAANQTAGGFGPSTSSNPANNGIG